MEACKASNEKDKQEPLVLSLSLLELKLLSDDGVDGGADGW